MRSVTLFIMLDACRPDYILPETMPFLYRTGMNGYASALTPTFGFEPDAAYLAGIYPDQAGQGAQFWFDPEKSPFKGMIPEMAAPVLAALPSLPKKIVRKALTRMARRRSASPHLSAAAIPFSLLDRFGLPVRVNLDQEGFCAPHPTLFDLLRVRNKPYLFHGAPAHAVTLKAALAHAGKNLFAPLDFAFFHIGTLDRVGHAFGPNSPETRAALGQVDKDLELLYGLARHRFDRVNLVVMGDHGMAPVTDLLNPGLALESMNRAHGLVPGKDYLYMLDSTMARFWIFNPVARKRICDLPVFNTPLGRFLTQADRDRFHLNYGHDRFGELIFLVRPGVLIFPNFFQDNRPVLGMHGYAPDTDAQKAALVMDFPGKADSGTSAPHMTQVFATMCDLLDLDKPQTCNAESLVIS